MPQASFGMILREARERKGLDIQSVSRRLRVRPDILRALEESDFSSLPARGYTRNMVAAYARLVGLNPSDITDMYLDQMYSHQVRLSRKEVDSPAHVSGRRSVAHDEGRTRRSRRDRDEAYADEDSRVRQSGQRRLRGDDSARSSRDSRNSRRGQEQVSLRSARNARGSSRGSSRRQPERGGLQDTLAVRAARAEGKSRRVGESTSMNHLGNLYSGMASVAQGNSPRMLVGIVAAVILILLVIIFALIFGNHGSTQSQEITKVPITGVTDTSNSESSTSDSASSQSQSSQVKVPTSVSVEYKLASGQEAYVVITNDGTSTEQMLTGPVDETVDVSGTWSLSTYVSDAFTITMGGKTVEFETDTTSGMPTATVDFSDYLKTWAQEHPDVKVDTSSSTSSSSDSTTSSGTSGSNSSSSSTTGSSSPTVSSSSTTGSSSGTTSSNSSRTTSSTGSGTTSFTTASTSA